MPDPLPADSAILSMDIPRAKTVDTHLTTAADLDRLRHNRQSRFTDGHSPSIVGLAFLDWAAHAGNAPFQSDAFARRFAYVPEA